VKDYLQKKWWEGYVKNHLKNSEVTPLVMNPFMTGFTKEMESMKDSNNIFEENKCEDGNEEGE